MTSLVEMLNPSRLSGVLNALQRAAGEQCKCCITESSSTGPGPGSSPEPGHSSSTGPGPGPGPEPGHSSSTHSSSTHSSPTASSGEPCETPEITVEVYVYEDFGTDQELLTQYSVSDFGHGVQVPSQEIDCMTAITSCHGMVPYGCDGGGWPSPGSYTSIPSFYVSFGGEPNFCNCGHATVPVWIYVERTYNVEVGAKVTCEDCDGSVTTNATSDTLTFKSRDIPSSRSVTVETPLVSCSCGSAGGAKHSITLNCSESQEIWDETSCKESPCPCAEMKITVSVSAYYRRPGSSEYMSVGSGSSTCKIAAGTCTATCELGITGTVEKEERGSCKGATWQSVTVAGKTITATVKADGSLTEPDCETSCSVVVYLTS